MTSTDGGARLTLCAMFEETENKHGELTAIVDGDQSLTYSELFEQSRRFGAALIAHGVQPRDRVAVWAPNCVEWVISYLGLLQAGATLVPLNTRYKGVEAASLLQRGKVRALITVVDFLGVNYPKMLADTGELFPDLSVVVVAGNLADPPSTSWEAFMATAANDDLAELDRRRFAVTAQDPADILFTSGTTGTPKGALVTHVSSLTSARDWVDMAGLGEGDRYLMINPYFHMFGLKAGILSSIAAGVTMLPMPVFDVARALEHVSRFKVTVLPGPPTLYQSILDDPLRANYDLSSLRVAVTGAADIPVQLIERVFAELPFTEVVSGYGLTEAGTATGTGRADSPATIATTVGRARPGFEVRTVDSEGRDVGPDEVGEVYLRSPTVMDRYIDDPEATTAALTSDRWFRTGDLGRLDGDGYLRITGRLKDMFTVGGFNVYPAEIESILLRHADIQAVAVVGIPDHRLGEVGAAFVVVANGSLTADVIAVWAKENMANYKVPRRYELVSALPLNATGKVQKRELRDRLLASVVEAEKT